MTTDTLPENDQHLIHCYLDPDVTLDDLCLIARCERQRRHAIDPDDRSDSSDPRAPGHQGVGQDPRGR